MTRRARILYVEDTPQNRLLVQRLVRSRGWEYLEAENGEVALEILESEENLPDVILMDLAMPRMDGYETTRRIKDDPRLRDIPVLALTAHAMPEDQQRALEAGCDMYFTKPIDTGGLLDILKGLLEARSLTGSAPLSRQLRGALDRLILCEGSQKEDLKPYLEALKVLLGKIGPKDS